MLMMNIGFTSIALIWPFHRQQVRHRRYIGSHTVLIAGLETFWYCWSCRGTAGFRPKKNPNASDGDDKNDRTYADGKQNAEKVKGFRKRRDKPSATKTSIGNPSRTQGQGTKDKPAYERDNHADNDIDNGGIVSQKREDASPAIENTFGQVQELQGHGSEDEAPNDGDANDKDSNREMVSRKQGNLSLGTGIAYGQARTYEGNYMSEESNDDARDEDVNQRGTSRKRKIAFSANVTTSGHIAAPSNPKSSNWTVYEKNLVIELMHIVMAYNNKTSKTEARWREVEALLKEYGVTRSPTAIKNYWNREGRATSGLDERNKPNPDNLVTGVQSADSRREKRQKAKEAEKAKGPARISTLGIKVEDASGPVGSGDDHTEQIAKRQKHFD